VADAYHAMVHDRPYKTALSHDEALAELRANAGTQFDPDVVNVFCAVYAEGVPPDGLEEVYKLHERARGGLERIDPHAAAAMLYGNGNGKLDAQPPAGRKSKARRARGPQPAEATADGQDGHSHPHPIREATG
jgi:hypothetical protein